MKKSLLIITTALLLSTGLYVACRPEMTDHIATVHTDTPSTNTTAANQLAAASCCWVVTTNQASRKIEIYDPAVTDWNTSAALKHSWYPNASNGFTNPTVGWLQPSDARLRNSSFFGGQQMLVTDSKGFCAIIPYPSLTGKKWAINLGEGVNPHSIELLPNGNVAIAASEANWVRVYTSSQGVWSTVNKSFALRAAHAVLWDPANNILWVTGWLPLVSDKHTDLANHVLTALAITGTAANPILTEVTSRQSPLPSFWGHDIQPYTGDVNKLWVSTNAGVYIYNKTTKVFTTAPANIGNRTFVKGISNQPSGIVVLTRPDSIKTPIPSQPSTTNSWTTSYVDFYSAAGAFQSSGHKNGASWYKGRIWTPDYQ